MQNSLKKIAVFFLIGAVGLFFLVWTAVFAKARIIVLSRPEDIDTNATIKVSRTPKEEEIHGDVFVLEDIFSQSFPVTGGAIVDTAAKAEGTVKIQSTLTRPQTLIATTRILAQNGILFRLKQAVNIAPQATVTAAVIADQSGTSGTVDPTTFTIPGLTADLQKFFTVTSEAKFTLPYVKTDKAEVAPEAAATAIETLKTQASEKLRERLVSYATTANTTYTSNVFIFVITKKDIQPPTDADPNNFNVTLSVRGTAMYYDQPEYEKALEKRLSEEIPFGRSLGRIILDGSIPVIDRVDSASGSGSLKVKIRGTMVISGKLPVLDPRQFTGVTADAAQKYSERTDGIVSVSIKLWPPWQRRLPDNPERIIVEIR